MLAYLVDLFLSVCLSVWLLALGWGVGVSWLASYLIYLHVFVVFE